MKIFVSTDLEGATGVCLFSQTREEGPRYEEARGLLMGDVAACVEGLRAGGADDILVHDSHGFQPLNFVPDRLPPGARYAVGECGGARKMLDDSFDAVVLLAHHAMAGTPDGVLCHTQSSRRGDRYWYNDRESGEIAQAALVAGHFGLPVILVTGDDATCREARDFLGDNVVTASVKTGLSREGAILLPPDEARARIRDAAREAVGRVDRCMPYAIDLPIRGALRYPDKETADAWATGRSRRADDCTFETTFSSALDIRAF
jgi:D-amino peptidase